MLTLMPEALHGDFSYHFILWAAQPTSPGHSIDHHESCRVYKDDLVSLGMHMCTVCVLCPLVVCWGYLPFQQWSKLNSLANRFNAGHAVEYE